LNAGAQFRGKVGGLGSGEEALPIHYAASGEASEKLFSQRRRERRGDKERRGKGLFPLRHGEHQEGKNPSLRPLRLCENKVFRPSSGTCGTSKRHFSQRRRERREDKKRWGKGLFPLRHREHQKAKSSSLRFLRLCENKVFMPL
jgi:hypothetical protein